MLKTISASCGSSNLSVGYLFQNISMFFPFSLGLVCAERRWIMRALFQQPEHQQAGRWQRYVNLRGEDKQMWHKKRGVVDWGGGRLVIQCYAFKWHRVLGNSPPFRVTWCSDESVLESNLVVTLGFSPGQLHSVPCEHAQRPLKHLHSKTVNKDGWGCWGGAQLS